MTRRSVMPAVLALLLALLAGGAVAQRSQGDPFEGVGPREGPSAPAPSAAHWLIGRWEGDIAGLVSEQGTRRILTVHRVEANGDVVGTWAARGAGTGSRIRVEGDTVRVLTAFQHTATLRRAGPNVLRGIFVTTAATGRTYNITMQRR